MASQDKPVSQSQDEQKPAVPSISLPKGGGAIRGIGEKFAANPVTGTGSMSVPLATSPGRSGFGPQLSLAYDSGSANSPFGFGWSLSLPSITRKTDKGLPQYFDAVDSDVFILSGAEDLVPVYRQDLDGTWIAGRPGFQRDADGFWVRDPSGRLVVHEDELDGYRVRRYRPRIEGLFARIERWSTIGSPGDVHWRAISKDNILTLYGQDAKSRIADPLDASRIFSWLICESRDDKGNGIRYLYKEEDGVYQPRPGQADPFKQAHQHNRGTATDRHRTAQRYLQRVLYGNVTPLLDAANQRPRHLSDLPHPPSDTSADWLFEVRFDYGELDDGDPTGQPEKPWLYRPDAFSSYRSGFEVRTCRRCERVLMLHHIPDQPEAPGRSAQPGYRGVVRSTEFTYDDELDPSLATRPVYSFLKQVVQTGWKQEGGSTARRSLPPVEFEYTKPEVQEVVEETDAESLENLPVGLDGSAYRWTDLHGEGIPGILTEQAGSWFYKRNLSPIPEKMPEGRELVKAQFAPLETVALKPNIALSGGAEFMDLAGDGQPDVVVMEGPTPGLYEHDEAEGWQPFRPFTSRLNLDTRDPNVKFVDLDGDGHADVLITEDNVLVWHASLAEEGFGPARRVAQALDEEKGPRVAFADGTQSIYLADLSGDGLTDIVRIRNGEVCYWPNLGYGRFGAKVTMDNAPWFDHADQFDHKRIRLADIDGSGTTDIIYLHRDGVRLYFNQSGNSWSKPQQLKVAPRIDEVVSIVPIDLIGNGTACLVWSSPLPGDARRQMRYVDLMGGTKPHLLVKTVNNLGAETRVDYAPSIKFYLLDKRDRKPWITRLPFPVHVVEKVTTYDHIGRNRFVTRYEYHHGYFDGEEREFRGFGMVEQWDTDEIGSADSPEAAGSTNWDEASFVPPVYTKTWFHTGIYLGRNRVSNYFAELLDERDIGEYYPTTRSGDPAADAVAKALLLEDTILPSGLSHEEEREACRALKGSMLRQEVYAQDKTDKAKHPYTVTEQNFTIKRLQPRSENRHAVFFTHPREAIAYHYERNPDDPRIQHALTLEVDNYGNVLRSAAIGYGRRAGMSSLQGEDKTKQEQVHITCTENDLTNAIDLPVSYLHYDPDNYRAPLPSTSRTYELRKAEQETSTNGQITRYTPNEVRSFITQASDGQHNIDYEDLLFDTAKRAAAINAVEATRYFRRLIEHVRTYYRPDDFGISNNDPWTLLPLGQLQSLALPGESYKQAFTPGLLSKIYARAGQNLLTPNTATVLSSTAGDGGGYVDLDNDNHWWIPSGRVYYHPGADAAHPASAAVERNEAHGHFFQPRRYTDPFGYSSTVAYQHDLLVHETKDALGNTVQATNDYRVLQPAILTDPNGNRTFAAFDALGLVAATAVSGKNGEGDIIDDFTQDATQELTNPTLATLQEFVKDPREKAASLLKRATTRILYDLDRFSRCGQPPFAATLARETHVSDLEDDAESKIQISFLYSDGFGRELQSKIQAEGGKAPVRNPLTVDVDAGDIKPGPLVIENGEPKREETTHRWVGKGRTVYNNKGKPIKQYEPFFSSTHLYEEEPEMTDTGVTPVLFYDPVERVIATLHPNHTYEKVVFDPWQQTTYDVNDTCAALNQQTGDPRTDPDIQGYVAEYFKTQPANWQTWHAQRTGGALGADEQNAAQRAAAHADTPATAYFDALGRPFLTLAHNGFMPDGTAIQYPTRVLLDIEGNQREVRDGVVQAGDVRGRIVMRYAYDMLGNRIRQSSMEAGERWMLNDVAGKPILAWDSRGHNFTTEYDQLRRPIGRRVTGTDPAQSDPRTLNQDVLFEVIEYGEGQPNDTVFNLRTRIFKSYDGAGVVTNEAYDFKGNLQRSARTLADDYKKLYDWGVDDVQHQWESFAGSTRYDALNRPIQLITPHGGTTKSSIIQPLYNDANFLEKLDVWLQRDVVPANLLDAGTADYHPVVNIDYNEKGQRARIEYDNGAETHYRYNPETFRLVHLYTRRGGAFTSDCENASPPPALVAAPEPEDLPVNRHCGLQNLRYTYDPAGNITHIQDDAQQTIFFANQLIEPSADYTYDAIYRLIEATGREHLGQNGVAIPHSHDDAARVRLPQPNDGNAMGRYCETYEYDAVGNIMEMIHRVSCSGGESWRRSYTYGEASQLELGKQSNRLTRTTVGATTESYSAGGDGYDAHGSMLHMRHLSRMQWDHKDQLQATARQKVNDPECSPETTWYVYDAGGQRVRKVTDAYAGPGETPTRREESIYLGGFEIYREYNGPSTGSGQAISLEREALHVMDDKQRIALVETKTVDAQSSVLSPQSMFRFQFGNHLGSASLELDDQAEVISYEEYYPYGSTSYQAVQNGVEVSPKRYRYTGKERDEESGLYYHGVRYYAAWLGRWTSCDPLGSSGSSLYIGLGNNPVNRIDPLGTSERPPNVDDIKSMLRQIDEKNIIRPLLYIPTREEEASRQQLNNVLVIGPLGTMRAETYKRKEEHVRNNALLEGGRGYITGAMAFSIAQEYSDNPSDWMAAHEAGEALMRMAGASVGMIEAMRQNQAISQTKPEKTQMTLSAGQTAEDVTPSSSLPPASAGEIETYLKGAAQGFSEYLGQAAVKLTGIPKGAATFSVGIGIDPRSVASDKRYAHIAVGTSSEWRRFQRVGLQDAMPVETVFVETVVGRHAEVGPTIYFSVILEIRMGAIGANIGHCPGCKQGILSRGLTPANPSIYRGRKTGDWTGTINYLPVPRGERIIAPREGSSIIFRGTL